jgi:hypothetical protein
MRRSLLTLLALAAAWNVARAEPPAVTARQALDIAEQSLRDRGLDHRLHVVSVALEKSSLMSGKAFWFVKWSEPIPASDPKNREVGVKVAMDGTATRLVKEPH